jgi:hypothetical protein
MAGPPRTYRVKATVVLPFRADVAAGQTRSVFGSDDDPTDFVIAYSDTLELTGDEQSPPLRIPTQLCTYVFVEYPQRFNGEEAEFRDWLTTNASRLIQVEVLPRVNHLLAAIQVADVERYRTVALRNVGELDLIFQSVGFGDDVVFNRGTSTFFAAASVPTDQAAIPSELPNDFPPEWLLLTRAVHLANHGFHAEAVLVAFALLDLQVQLFLAPRFPNLDAEAGDELLRVVEARRLKRYLGLMMRLATGASPLDEPDVDSELAWLNELRNGLIHSASGCSMAETQRALRLVHRLLGWLNDHGAALMLPDVLRFWTPEAGAGAD